MSATRIKICGIRSATDLDLAVSAGADAIGIISGVTVDTPREVSTECARELAALAPPFVTTVLVTMGDSVETVEELVEAIRPDTVQVHGAFTPDDVARLAVRRPVIRALDVTNSEAIRAQAAVSDALLLDSLDETGAGGTGHTHDWERSRDVVEQLSTPVILAGGLTPENVAEAIKTVRPYGVDVASGVESDDGKDPDAVRRFIEAATVSPRGEVP